MKLTPLSIAAGLALGAIILVLSACGGSDEPSSSTGTPSGDDFDRTFIDAMVPHHEGAIAMAQAAKEVGLSQPALVQVADDILATQQGEIDQMKEWREEWFGSSTIEPKGPEALGLSDSQMGMMEDDVEALRSSGDVDTDFAQLMIAHHESAIEMAKLAAENAERQEIKDLAEGIVEAQKREIEVLRPHAAGGSMDHG